MSRRTSRWDRPPAPKDVRWFVRLFGKVLIIIGLLMFGFVAYQLWGTGIEYARAQNRLENEFEDLLERVSTTTDATTTAVPTSTTSTTSTTTVPSTSEVAAVTTAPATTTTTSTTTATTTSTTLAPTTTVPVFDIAAMAIEDGDVIGQLHVESAGIDDFVVAGVTREDLQLGPGHYPQTPMPGQLGNSAIAGHRTTWGQPFFDIDQIEPGDDIVVTMPYGTFVYVARETVIVDPSNWEVIATTDSSVATLTLTSCHPKFSASQRIIVHADLDLTRSTAPGQPVFNYGRGGEATTEQTLPGDDVVALSPTTLEPTTEAPTTAAPTTAATTLLDTSSSAPESSAATTTATTTTTPATTEPPDTLTPDTLYSVLPGGGSIGGQDVADDGAEAEDAFSNHWFDDTAAWPQVALWGGLAAVVVVAGYELARLVRNSWIGLAAGFAPFLVALYFFYQNVNRLLPAAL